MPYAAPRPCGTPGCKRLVQSGRCPEHMRARGREKDDRRESRSVRGYTRTWYKFRAAYIATVVADNPFCMDCHRGFGSTREIELHHKEKVSERPELMYEHSNIRHLCQRCHAVRTGKGE